MFTQSDWNEINKLIELGFISKRRHPVFEYWILNYTVKTQFDWFWNKYTKACRGLIVNKKNKIIARPFEKFFNDDQLERDGVLIPKEPFEAFEKMDGSLGIMFHHYSLTYKKWSHHIATRGSFESDQAKKANKLLHTKYKNIKFNPKYTYLFEIICPESKVVVDYFEEKLVLLAIIETKTGVELNYKEMCKTAPKGIEIVKHYKAKDWRKLLDKYNGYNREGFVIKFKSGFRVKIKYEKYKELHKAICGLSKRRLWEQLKNGKTKAQIIELIPDEFHPWTKKQIYDLENEHKQIVTECLKKFDEVKRGLKNYTQKEFAMAIKDYKYKAILFLMNGNKEWLDFIWKLIKPEGNITYTNEKE